MAAPGVAATDVRDRRRLRGPLRVRVGNRRGGARYFPNAELALHGARVVRALVPLSEMFGYVGDLRSKTQGRAQYTMQFDSYQQCPANVQEEIIKKIRGE